MEPSPYLEKLRTLTGELPILDDFIKFQNGNGNIEYIPNGDGEIKGRGLYKDKDVAIQLVSISKGTVVPEHIHKEIEIGIVYKGKAILDYGCDKKECVTGNHVHFEPNEPHSFVMLEDTLMVFITVPAGKGYPNAR